MSPWIANVGEACAEQMEPQPNTVCISITEPNRKARLPKFDDLLRLQFQDYDADRKHPDSAVMFSPTLAARIARFLRKHREREANIVVHCAAGVSRSGAIAEAALEAFQEYEDRGWPRFPNNYVKRLMSVALGLAPIGAEPDKR